jgi:hypothetical protein
MIDETTLQFQRPTRRGNCRIGRPTVIELLRQVTATNSAGTPNPLLQDFVAKSLGLGSRDGRTSFHVITNE